MRNSHLNPHCNRLPCAGYYPGKLHHTPLHASLKSTDWKYSTMVCRQLHNQCCQKVCRFAGPNHCAHHLLCSCPARGAGWGPGLTSPPSLDITTPSAVEAVITTAWGSPAHSCCCVLYLAMTANCVRQQHPHHTVHEKRVFNMQCSTTQLQRLQFQFCRACLCSRLLS